MTSLWSLAQERKQPDFQYMDQETLDQIQANKPEFSHEGVSFDLNQSDIDLLLDLSPKEDWYLEPKIVSSIHGIAHTCRVMLYAYLLAKDEVNLEELKAILFACSVHDTQRLDDKGDEGHEVRALEWLKKNFPKHESFDLVYQILEGTHGHEKYLRTADALDRYRLPKVKWWIDDSYLSIKPNESFKIFAFNLIICSEQKILNGSDLKTVILDCLAI